MNEQSRQLQGIARELLEQLYLEDAWKGGTPSIMAAAVDGGLPNIRDFLEFLKRHPNQPLVQKFSEENARLIEEVEKAPESRSEDDAPNIFDERTKAINVFNALKERSLIDVEEQLAEVLSKALGIEVSFTIEQLSGGHQRSGDTSITASVRAKLDNWF